MYFLVKIVSFIVIFDRIAKYCYKKTNIYK